MSALAGVEAELRAEVLARDCEGIESATLCGPTHPKCTFVHAERVPSEELRRRVLLVLLKEPVGFGDVGRVRRPEVVYDRCWAEVVRPAGNQNLFSARISSVRLEERTL